MAKRTETQLVVTAKDLGSAKLKDLAAAFRALRKDQQDTAAVADRTKVKQAELSATLSGLNKVLGELAGRQSKLDLFRKLGTDVEAAKERLATATQKLKEFGAANAAAGVKTTELKAAQKALQTEVSKSQSALSKLAGSYERVGKQIDSLELNSVQAQQSLNRMVAVTARAAAETEAALLQLPRQQRLYRDELERTTTAERERLAAEKQANEEAKQRLLLQNKALKLASQTRLAQERGVKSGFSNFSQRVDSGAIRNEVAAQRLVDIQKRAEVVESRLNAERAKSVGILGRVAGALRGTTVAQERANKAQKSGVDLQRTALSLGQRVRGQILSIAAAYVGVYGVISAGQRALNVSNERIALNSRLLVANADDQRGAADDLKYLRDEADRLGFSLTELGTNYSKLAIAGRSAGLATSEVREIFSGFSEVARVNNLGVEQTERVFKALEQILSKGKVQAEELRGQLGDVLPGAYSAFARSLGVSGQELNKLLEEGRVSSSALVGFSREYAAAVAGQLAPASKNLRAELGRLNTAYDDFLQNIADESLAPAVREISAALREFLTSAEGKQFGKEVADGIKQIGYFAIEAAKNMGLLISLGKAFIGALAIGQLGRMAAGVGAFAGSIARLGIVVRSTIPIIVTLRTALLGLSAFAGPVGIAIAALGVAWLLYADHASDAEKVQAELNAQFAKAKTAVDGAAAAASNLQQAQDAVADAELNVADASKKSAEAKAKLAAEGGKAAQASYDQAKAAEEDKKKTLELAKSKRELLVQIEANARREADIAVKGSANRLKEVRSRLAVAQAALIEARAKAEAANQEVQNASGRSLDLRGGQAALADSQARAGERRVKELKTQEAQLSKQLAELLASVTSDTSRVGAPPGTSESPILDKEGTAKAARDKSAQEAERLAQETADAIRDIYRSGLEQQTQDEAKALEAKRQLVNDDYNKRVADLDALINQNRASGQNQAVELLTASRVELEKQRTVALDLLQAEYDRVGLLKDLESRERAITTLATEREAKLAEIERQRIAFRITDEAASIQSYAVELEYQKKIQEAVALLRSFILAGKADGSLKLFTPEELQEIIDRINGIGEAASAGIDPVKTKVNELREEIAGGLTSSVSALAQGFAGWIQGVNSFSDAIKGAWNTFRSFIADFLVKIGEAILQQTILTALQNATQGSTGFGGLLNSVAGAMLGGSAHTGGIVGTQAKNRSLSPAIFAAAQRYHTGGVVGLGPDEVPIVAKRGEEVLTENDARHRNNGGGAGQQIKIINAIDSSSVVQEGLNSPAGVRSVMNVVRANKAAFKAALA